MQYKLVSFDFDGTLCNSFDAIKAALAIVIPDANLSDLSGKLMSGEAFTCVLQSLSHSKLSEETLFRLYDEFCHVYHNKCAHLQSLYPYSASLLRTFRSQGCHLVIVSNKEEGALHDFLYEHHLAETFDLVIGEREGLMKKPSPESYYDIIMPVFPELQPQQMLHIGDTLIDIDYAKAIGADSAYVCHGFGCDEICIKHKPTFFYSSFKECLDAFNH
ncbi:HAD family hydrolase [Shewanella surugensis]|uniref:phosphoglycolate phosphatase n=1 Tax=Shewanella surugensis TaxID=212020 RepID=A0ABT0LCJ6_9GAMM|nr:HAD family hydrolase [Shewanella surugensis]MCL1125067.1 HAD family hydrolase [Shewanella surugensis]